MTTLRHLTEYLSRLPFVERDHFESDQVESSLIIPSLTRIDVPNDIWLLYREQYEAVLYFEAYVHPKEQVLSHITAWLIEHGGDRDEETLGFPRAEPLKNDDGSVDLMVTLRFEEAVYATPDPAGELSMMGKRWRRCVWEPDEADEFTLDGTLTDG